VAETKVDVDYYHKVVDCQWACPAHTPVPEYIRLIGEGRYSEAYMINRDSNVFPGILGRVCDRPCEPACRRGRLEDEEPVAICRLKRVAADYKGDVSALLPQAPSEKNGKKVALIGAGPASLTVANDLAPLGYDVTIYEKNKKAGGAMRFAVPMFRLPPKVLDEEIDAIVNMGINMKYDTPVSSLKNLLTDYDSIFIGAGAPIGRDLEIPGREDSEGSVHVGLDWLANVAFEHTKSIQEKVIVIGGGNTAMDCCRTARRIGGKQVKVIAPESFEQMLASPWEKDDSQEEKIEFINHLLPQEFVVDNGKFKGVRFQHLKQCYDENMKWDPVPSGEADVFIECDDVILAIGQSTAFNYIESDVGIDFNDRKMPVVDSVTYQSSNPKVFFGGDAAFGPKNIIWAVAHGHEAAISIHSYLQGLSVNDRPPRGMNLISQKMGIHQWSYGNDYSDDKRFKVPHVEVGRRIDELKTEVELGYDEKLAIEEASRCLNCDVQTVFDTPSCIECDACVDICPVKCLTMTEDLPIEELKAQLSAPVLNSEQNMLISGPLVQTKRIMVKDEDLCVHCGLCAERCPTGAWDMQKFILDLPKASDL